MTSNNEQSRNGKRIKLALPGRSSNQVPFEPSCRSRANTSIADLGTVPRWIVYILAVLVCLAGYKIL
jgi:hypothetical protein